MPVMLADLQSRGARYCFNLDYNMYMPVGERPADLLYEHLPLYVGKVMNDLKKIRAWDRHERKHVRALWRYVIGCPSPLAAVCRCILSSRCVLYAALIWSRCMLALALMMSCVTGA